MLVGKAAQVRAAYDEAWARHRSALTDQRRLGGDRMSLERELDLVRYQAGEISAAGLERGDDIRLESMAARLRNAEVILEHLSAATTELEAAGESIGSALSRLRKLADIDPGLGARASDAETVDVLTHELLGAVRELAESATEDPGDLALLEQRLTSLGDLKRKYGHTLEAVLDFGEAAAMRAAELEQLLDRAANIDTLITRSEADLVEVGEALTTARRSAIGQIEDEARRHLAALGLPAATLRFTIEPAELGPSGADRVELVFASDDRLAGGSIQEVASGGELSRLVLALRLATRSKETDTLVFDEVDAGVGGRTALALGRKLADLSRACQVLCVTHLPQVAAHAETHYVIERTGPTAIVREVDGDARITELSRMLAGLPESSKGREAAAELLEGART
jgi:DNA repair protein RecN (Recombination protein N)